MSKRKVHMIKERHFCEGRNFPFVEFYCGRGFVEETSYDCSEKWNVVTCEACLKRKEAT